MVICLFAPDKGEFDNQTTFLHPGDELKREYHAKMIPTTEITGIAVTSDGPEHLMFQLPEMISGPIFSKMSEDLGAGNLQRQDLLDYLTGTRWSRDPRGNDDWSLSIITAV